MPSKPAATFAELGDHIAGLRELFDAVVEIAPAERERWLAERVDDAGARAALVQLLAADADAGFLETPAEVLHARIGAADVVGAGWVGREIAGFRLVRTLGEGGMAAVFLGERVGRDFTQQAAIKLLRRGLYSELEQRLFQRERRVLASLAHPNIARLIDGGVTDAGIPYLVLEYVDGVPITDHARGLDLRAKLELFRAVCAAVEAAHRALIVHRDIKPANILVTAQGEAKLLDFGIAKLIEDGPEATVAGVFTRHYAAPEQLHGGTITTATDVYGLGVLLRELLLGFNPDGDSGEDSAPQKLSVLVASDASNASATHAEATESLRRRLRGDLDNIALKALDPDPARRYASAGALADDIARHLDGRPVLAHPPTRWYRTRKFLRRHRGGVTITAILILAVFAALAVALWQAGVAQREARLAHTQAEKAARIAEFAGRMLSGVDPNRAKSMDRSLMRLLLDSAARDAQHDLGAEPAVRASIEEIIAASYASISEFALADTHLLAAQDAARDAGLDTAQRTRLAAQRANVLFNLGERKDETRLLDRQALASAAELPEGHRERLFAQAIALAHECHWRPDAACSERFAPITALARGALAENDPYLLHVLKGQMVANAASGRYEQAGALYHELVERNRALYGDDDSRTLQAIRNLANFDDSAHGNDPGEGERLLRENLPVAQRVLGAEHAITIGMTYDLGRNLAEQGRHADAKPLLQHALASMTALHGAQAMPTIIADYSLTKTLLALGELDAAEERARARIAAQQTAPGHGDHGIFRTLLADILVAEKRYADAERELDSAYAAAARDAIATDDAGSGIAAAYVALYTAWNKPELARSWRERMSDKAVHAK